MCRFGRIGLGVAVVLLAGTVWAAGGLEPQAVIQQFQADHPQTRFYMQGEQILRVYGAAFGAGATPEESADGFLTQYAGMFGVRVDELVPGNEFNDLAAQPVMYEPERGDYRFYLVYRAQYEGDIPVYGAEVRLLVRNEPGFPLVLVSSTLRDLGDFALPARAGMVEPGDVGHAAARALIPDLVNFTPSRYVVWPGDGNGSSPALAVTFVADNGMDGATEPQKWRMVADAATGEILYRKSLIIFTNVNGSVSGMATQGPKSDDCAPEAATPMPYASVSISGGSSAYADGEGDFTIPNGGSAAVVVQSPMSGRYFTVSNAQGGTETLSLSVTPPGPANFMHNAANTSEQVRAQVNGYVQANIVRDFALTYNPAYPTIATQTNFPVVVNRTDFYCPGNAWYDGSSINFCSSSDPYPNTAYSNVVHHEYGHHLVEVGGSGQDQYGEGMGDSVAMLIADDPILGYGFEGDCNAGIRTAVNTMQYPCTSDIHTCAQLLSGCIWDTRNALKITNPTTYRQILGNLTINSILLHSGGSIAPDITIDFLTLDDDDGNINNGTPHSNEICTGFNAHNMDCPASLLGIHVTPADGLDAAGDAGGPFTPGSKAYTVQNESASAMNYAVSKTQPWVTLSSAGGTLGGGASTTVTVSIDSDANVLGNGVYSDTVTFVNTTNHSGDTVRTVVLHVGTPEFVYGWNLNTDPGWSAEGEWAWGQPTGGGGTHGNADPTGGATGVNVYGVNLDGDYATTIGGPYYLMLGPIDLSEVTQTTLKFQRWLNSDYQPYVYATVDVSNDGTNWTPVWSNGGTVMTENAWSLRTYDISATADDQGSVYVRWGYRVASGAWAYSGWNLDDIEIWGLVAGAGPHSLGDLNCDGAINNFDINPFVLALTNPAGYEAAYPDCDINLADINGDGDVNNFDINPFVQLLTGP